MLHRLIVGYGGYVMYELVYEISMYLLRIGTVQHGVLNKLESSD